MTKKICSLFIIMAMLLGFGVASAVVNAAEPGKVIYVATNGRGNAAGTIDDPFKTILDARDAIRNLKRTTGLPKGGVTVYIRGGFYEVRSELAFTEIDSGTKDKPITYKAYPGEKPIISGGLNISGSDFEKVTDNTVLSRLSNNDVKNNLVAVNLKDYGYTDYPKWTKANNAHRGVSGVMVFINDTYMDLARYPNKSSDGDTEWIRAGTILISQREDSTGKGPKWQYTDGRPDKWQTYENCLVFACIPSWSSHMSIIDSIDKTNKTIQMKYPASYTMPKTGRYFYANILEELDAENEYFVDYNTGMLYMYPPKEVDIETATIGVTKYGKTYNDTLIGIRGADYITLDGLRVELSNAHGISVIGSENILVTNCEIMNHGLSGIGFGARDHYEKAVAARGLNMIYEAKKYWDWNVRMATKEAYEKQTVRNSGITNSRIGNCGSHGVTIAGGDRLDLEAGNNFATNNLIHDAGITHYMEGHLLNIYGMGNYAGYNTIKNSEGMAVHYGGNELIMEYNDISNALRSSADMGVFYTEGWTAELNMRTEIRYNYIHDIEDEIEGDPGASGVYGLAQRHMIYNDNCQPFLEVHHNIFENGIFGEFQAAGYENNWRDNLFIDLSRPINKFYNNLMLDQYRTTGSPIGTLGFGEFEIIQDNEKWKERYPEIWEVAQKLTERKEEVKHADADITGNVMVFNEKKDLCFEAYTDYESDTRFLTIENNHWTTKDPGFVDLDGGDFRWREDAPIFETHPEMKKIDITKMGSSAFPEETARPVLKLSQYSIKSNGITLEFTDKLTGFTADLKDKNGNVIGTTENTNENTGNIVLSSAISNGTEYYLKYTAQSKNGKIYGSKKILNFAMTDYKEIIPFEFKEAEVTTKGLRLKFSDDVVSFSGALSDTKGNILPTEYFIRDEEVNVKSEKVMELDKQYILTYSASSENGTVTESKKITFDTVFYDDFEGYSSIDDLDANYTVMDMGANVINGAFSNYKSAYTLYEENENTWLNILTNGKYLRPKKCTQNVIYEIDMKHKNSTVEKPLNPQFIIHTYTVCEGVPSRWIRGFVSGIDYEDSLFVYFRETKDKETFAFVRETDSTRPGKYYVASYYDGKYVGEETVESKNDNIWFNNFAVSAWNMKGEMLVDNIKIYHSSVEDYEFEPFSFKYDRIVRDGIYLTYSEKLKGTPSAQLTSKGKTVNTQVSLKGDTIVIKPSEKLNMNTEYKLTVADITAQSGSSTSYEKVFKLEQLFCDDFSGYNIQSDGSYDTKKFNQNYKFTGNVNWNAGNTGNDPSKPVNINGENLLYVGGDPYPRVNEETYSLPSNYTIEYDAGTLSNKYYRDFGPRILLDNKIGTYIDSETSGNVMEYWGYGLRVYGGVFNVGSYRQYPTAYNGSVYPKMVNTTISKIAYTGENGDSVFSYYENGNEVFTEIGFWPTGDIFRVSFGGRYNKAYMDNILVYKVTEINTNVPGTVYFETVKKVPDGVAGTYSIIGYEGDGDVIVAAYGENDKLLGMTVKSPKSSKEFKISCNKDEVKNIKIFVWNSLEKMRYCTSYDIVSLN